MIARVVVAVAMVVEVVVVVVVVALDSKSTLQRDWSWLMMCNSC